MINCVGVHLKALFWDYSYEGLLYDTTRPNLTLFDTFLHCCALSKLAIIVELIQYLVAFFSNGLC